MNKSFVNSHKAYTFYVTMFIFIKLITWKLVQTKFSICLNGNSKQKNMEPASYRSTIIHIIKPQKFQFGFCVFCMPVVKWQIVEGMTPSRQTIKWGKHCHTVIVEQLGRQ